jgi:hypothetical protein
MAKVRIERSTTAMAKIARNRVRPGQVFSIVKRDGTLGTKKFAAVGSNGKLYSLNLATGELASTKKPSRLVSVVGRFVVRAAPSYTAKATTRGLVKSGQMFTVKGGSTRYLHLGKTADGFVAINMASPLDDDYTVGRDAAKHVAVVGEAEFVVTHV